MNCYSFFVFFSISTYTASPAFAASTTHTAHAALQPLQLCQVISPMSSCMLGFISFDETHIDKQYEPIDSARCVWTHCNI